MYVDVLYLLAATGAVVHADGRGVGGDGVAYRREDGVQGAEQRLRLPRCEVLDAGGVDSGDEEGVAACDGAYVEEGDGILVLVDDVAGDSALYDVADEAGHQANLVYLFGGVFKN